MIYKNPGEIKHPLFFSLRIAGEVGKRGTRSGWLRLGLMKMSQKVYSNKENEIFPLI